jgi:hypothetical protein
MEENIMKYVVKNLLVAAAMAALVTVAFVPAFAGDKGNGAPSGPHYNLNLIGVQKGKTANMAGNNGARIFVPLWGSAKIMLCDSSDLSGPCYGDDFAVLDANGTDGVASFALPEPDPLNSGTTSYSVFARALGTPGGKASMNTCATDPTTGEVVCSMYVLNLDRSNKGFQNVSKELLYIYWDTDGNGSADVRVPLFYDSLQDYFWAYDNSGLKLAQLRFYPGVQTTVPTL